jgi:putative ABC transport system permease protein
MKTPLAIKNLTHIPARFALSCATIGFAVILMFMQAGFRNALLDSPVQILKTLGGDLVAVSPASYALASEQSFPASVLSQLRSQPGVQSVMPVYSERTFAMVRVINEETPQKARYIRVIAIPADGFPLGNAALNELRPLLSTSQNGIIDQLSKRTYGIPTDDPVALKATEVELNGRRLRIVGRVPIGTDFAHDGNVIIGEHSLGEYFPYRGNGNPTGIVDLAIIQLQPGADPQLTANELNALADQEGHGAFRVYTHQALVEKEQAYWAKATPIGVIFTSGMFVGFAVGVIICYQILFTEIFDHLPEFATLKAMGYRDGYFVKVVLQQSFLLATFGFLPGVLVSWGLFHLLQSQAGLPMELTLGRMQSVFVLTVGMCVLGGMLAMRKIITADPANLF